MKIQRLRLHEDIQHTYHPHGHCITYAATKSQKQQLNIGNTDLESQTQPYEAYSLERLKNLYSRFIHPCKDKNTKFTQKKPSPKKKKKEKKEETKLKLKQSSRVIHLQSLLPQSQKLSKPQPIIQIIRLGQKNEAICKTHIKSGSNR